MRLGVSGQLWRGGFTNEDVGLIAKARELGFDLFDLPALRPDRLDPARIREACRAAGIQPNVGTPAAPDRDLVDPDPDVRARGQRHLRACVDLAAAIGAPLVTGPFCAAPMRFWRSDAVAKRAEVERCAEGLRPVASYAAEHGVRLALEPLCRHESPFVNRVEDANVLVDLVDSPAFGLVLDTYHMNIEEKHLGGAIERAGRRLFHLHACENDRGTPGSGHVPWAEIAEALRRIDYRGAASIESFSYEDEELARAVSVWRPLEPSMEGLARDGATFLRALFDGVGL